MGATVSREHAKLPFAYTHARKEDHTCTVSASSSLASRRQRLAHRLLLIKSADSTSVTPIQPHRLYITEDGITPIPILPSSRGAGSPTAALSLASHSIAEEVDSENADIVSLSSILNQGPELELQWHAVGQDQGEPLFGSNTANAATSDSGSGINSLPDKNNDSGHESSFPHSRFITKESASNFNSRQHQPHSLSDHETAPCPYSQAGVGSSLLLPVAVTVGLDASLDPVSISSFVALCAITTASVVASNALSLSITPQSSGSLQSEIAEEAGVDQQDEAQLERHIERPRLHLTQHQKHSSRMIQKELTASEEDNRDGCDNRNKQSQNNKHEIDIMSALCIADPLEDSPKDAPFNFFDAEPTIHPLPDQYRLQTTLQRYATDGGSYTNENEVGPWMDRDSFGAVVHLPQDFFGSHKHHLIAEDEVLEEDFDHGDNRHSEGAYNRVWMSRKGKRLGTSISGYSSAALGSGSHSALNSSVDEDVDHLSPIPFSELPSLTNIGLCSHGIVKLSSNIHLLSSATCLQICCNDLCSIPPEIGYMCNLTLLDLSKNSLTTLPDSIQHLTKLVDLKLSFNFLESLPSAIGGLTKLNSLFLDNNRLNRIPTQIGQLKGLSILDLDNNPLSVLPAEIGQLQYLRRLRLDRCPLVQEFVHSPLHSPPTLLELAARVVVRRSIQAPSLLPAHLRAYLKTAQRCGFCNGPIFKSSFKRGKMMEKNGSYIPLEYTLCVPHWNTEMERVKMLFGPRPATAPPLPTPFENTLSSTPVSSTSGVQRHAQPGSTSAATLSSIEPTSTTSLSNHSRGTSMAPSVGGPVNPTIVTLSSGRSSVRELQTRVRSTSKSGSQEQNIFGDHPNPTAAFSTPSLSTATKPRFSIRLK